MVEDIGTHIILKHNCKIFKSYFDMDEFLTKNNHRWGNVLIEDKQNKISKLPITIQKFFIKSYFTQGIVYLSDNKPTYCSNTIKWLDKIEVQTYSQKRADKLCFDFLHDKYPEYGEFIQLF